MNDPRYTYADASDYYMLISMGDMLMHEPRTPRTLDPVFGIEDAEAGGYIAYTTGEEHAAKIVAALNATTEAGA